MKRGDFVQRAGALRMKSLNAAERTVRVVCSTDVVDSYGEVVDQTWDLTRFLANPVVLYAHNSRDLPIGGAENMGLIRGDNGREQLECDIRFASEVANPKAEQVFQLFKENVLRAVSVGFIPNTVREEKRDGRMVLVLSDNELHELSVTPVPANHEALAKDARNDGNDALRASRKDRSMLTQEDFDRLETKHLDALKTSGEAHTKALTAKDARILELEGEVGQVRAAVGAAEDAPAAAVVRTITALSALKVAAEDKALGLEIDALIGTKILPGERDEFVELARSNRPLFEKMVGKRGDLALTKRALPPAPGSGGHRNTAADDAADTDGSELADAINAQASA